MRKLLVVLAVLLAVGLFAGAQYWGGNGSTWEGTPTQLPGGTVTIKVYQWLDVTFTASEVHVKDYGESKVFTLGTLKIDTNCASGVKIQVDDYSINPNPGNNNFSNFKLFTLDDYQQEIEIKLKPNWSTEVKEGQRELKVRLDIGKDLQAGTYTFTFELNFQPTFSF